MSDSNSDSEDFHNIIKTSNRALQFVNNTLKENMQKMSLFSSEFVSKISLYSILLFITHRLTIGFKIKLFSLKKVKGVNLFNKL